MIELHNLVDKVNSGNRPNLQDIGKMMYFSGLAEANLEKAEYFYNEALKYVKDLDCPEWKRVIKDEIEKCSSWRDDIKNLRLKEMRRVKKSKEKGAKEKKEIIPENSNFEKSIIPLFTDFINFYETAKLKEKNERIKLAEKLLFNPYQDFWETYFRVFSTNPEKSKDIIFTANEEKYEKIINLIQEIDFVEISESVLRKCYQNFPIENIPKLYLIIGPHLTGGFWMFLNDEIVLGISLEFWQEKEESEIIEKIETTIAHEYSHALRNEIFFGKRLIDKIIDEGLAVTFSEMIFPHLQLEENLAFSKKDLNWCQKNENFLLRMVRNEWFKEDKEALNFYLASGKKFNQWFPVRTGYYLGYRIVKSLLNQNLSFEEIIQFSSERIIEQARKFFSPTPIKHRIKEKNVLSQIISGIKFIIRDKENNFAIAKHRMDGMFFSKSKGFIGKIEEQEGDIFQRAIITEILLDIYEYNPDLVNFSNFQDEIDYLVSRKLGKVKGGWSYFPDLPELPPDTDDLGQILQVLVKVKYNKICEIVEEPIKLLLQQGIYPDGTFATWIVDKNDSSEKSKLMRASIGKFWGVRYGKDIEVTANILYGLYLYDKIRFQNIIDRGISAIEKVQNSDGSWNSEWYWGKFYGSYVCSRILAIRNKKLPCIEKVKNFVTAEQNDDGGWGDPLNTSFALLTLLFLEKVGIKVDDHILKSGLNLLLNKQKSDGSWEKINFIKMLGGKANYGSETITTAFALKAIVKFLHNSTYSIK